MNDSDRKAFYETWASAWEQCGKSVTDRMLKFAFECLKQFDLADIQRAVMAHAQDPEAGQFAPKPADIIRHIEGTSDDKALEAWSLVLPGIRGDYTARANKVKFADPVIHMVVSEMGGFTQMGACKESELHWVQKEFMDRYNMRSRNPVESPEVLPTSDYPSDQRADVLTIGRDVPRLQ